MTLDITLDQDAEELVMIVDDHQVVKFSWDTKDGVRSVDRKTQALEEDDSELFDTLSKIAKSLFELNYR